MDGTNSNSKMDVIKSKCKQTLNADRDYKNVASVLMFYLALYAFLAGFYTLMLKGVMATSSSVANGSDTLLWSFFVIGVAFVLVVTVTVMISQYQEKQKVKDDAKMNDIMLAAAAAARKKNHLFNMKEDENTLHVV